MASMAPTEIQLTLKICLIFPFVPQNNKVHHYGVAQGTFWCTSHSWARVIFGPWEHVLLTIFIYWPRCGKCLDMIVFPDLVNFMHASLKCNQRSRLYAIQANLAVGMPQLGWLRFNWMFLSQNWVRFIAHIDLQEEKALPLVGLSFTS